jgi:ribosome-binding protein aMBF1 (putative translation factor)
MNNEESKLVDDTEEFEATLDRRYGVQGTASRLEFERDGIAMYLGGFVFDKRKERGMSRSKLGALIGRPASYVRDLEEGEIALDVRMLFIVFDTLGALDIFMALIAEVKKNMGIDLEPELPVDIEHHVG